MKMAKNGQFLHKLDTPTPRRRSARLGVKLRLGEPDVEFSIVLIHLGVAKLHLGVPASQDLVYFFR